MTEPRLKSKHHRMLVLWCVVIAGMLLSAGAGWWFHRSEQKRINHEFQRRTRSLINVVQQVVTSREEALVTLRELYHNSEEVTRSEFTMAAAALLERKPGITSLLWVPRVEAARRPIFEADAGTQTDSDFKIHRGTTGLRDNSPTHGDTYPVFHVCPHGAAPPEGLDLASLEIWPDLIDAAKSSDIRFAEPPELFTKDNTSPLCLFAIPVYRNAIPAGEAARMEALRGFIVGLLDPAVLLNRAVSRLPNQGLEVLLVERRKNLQYRPLHYIPAAGTIPAPEMPSVDMVRYEQHHKIDFEFGGGSWEMWTRPDPGWKGTQRTHLEFITGSFGLLFTGLLAFYLRGLFRKADAIEMVVAQRTAELTDTQNRLREDILQRVKTEQSLTASEERYRILISQSADAIWLLEIQPPVPVDEPVDSLVENILRTARIAECNTPAAHVYGHNQPSAVLGRDLTHFAPQSQQRHGSVIKAFLQSACHLAEHEAWDNRPGETRVFLHNLIGVLEDDRLVRIWITEREITHQRQLEQERQAIDRQQAEVQRLESLSVLAGGIAHDFNNLLTSILGHASLGRAAISPDSPLDANLIEIENASRQAASLCQQMLAFAGKGRFVVKPHDLSQLVKQAAHLLQTAIGKHCSLNLQLADPLPLAMADAVQIQQILTNLVLNASEAIGARGGQITISAGSIQPDQTTFDGCPYPPASAADTYVFLTVRDNGPGMDAMTLSHVFEPFFTTKFAGRGLGLPAALGIVRGHQGTLRVESEPGGGTSITLFLPATEIQPNGGLKSDTNTPWQAEGTLLIIDDEVSVRGVSERMARSLGFSALSAPDGIQGVELFRHYRSSITAALVDLSMPGLSGEETMQKIRHLAPAVPLLAMSGYNQPNTLNISGPPPVFLPKPFNMTQFQVAVRQATMKRSAGK